MDKKQLRIVFMGTPEFAVESLRRLVEGGYQVVGVVTQPDRPVGRHQDVLQPSAVKQYALSVGLPVLQPEKMKHNTAFLSELRALHADLQVVVAFRILPEVVFSMPRFGTFNVHAALLPQYRGAAPINWAIINGEQETGVTTFFLDAHVDTGQIIAQKHFPIPDDADAAYVYNGLMHLGADICLDTVDKVLATDGHVPTVPQPTVAELKPAPKIFKETCEIDWHQPAKHVYDFIRGLSPQPAAWTMLAVEDNDRPAMLKVFHSSKTGRAASATPGSVMVEGRSLFVAAADQWLRIDELQLSGKKRMPASAFLNGVRGLDGAQCVPAEKAGTVSDSPKTLKP